MSVLNAYCRAVQLQLRIQAWECSGNHSSATKSVNRSCLVRRESQPSPWVTVMAAAQDSHPMPRLMSRQEESRETGRTPMD